MRTTTIIRMVVIVSAKPYIGELHSCIWVRNNYVTSLGNYLVLRVSSCGNVSLDRIAPAMAQAAGISPPTSTSASSRVHRMFSSSAAESSQHHKPWPDASALPTRLAQAFDQVGVVLGPKPRDAVVHVHLECRRCVRNGLLQPLPRFCCTTQLPES